MGTAGCSVEKPARDPDNLNRLASFGTAPYSQSGGHEFESPSGQNIKMKVEDPGPWVTVF